MTAALFGARSERFEGLRPVDSRRDMLAIAELLDAAFSGQLDAAGLRMVSSMRAAGRAGWLGWIFGRLFLPPAAYPKGFVWEKDGQVVGNASLLAVDGHPRRWVLANVAVHPDHQRLGIGRTLVEACIDWAWSVGCRKLLLQVESDNRGAQILYAALGFRPIATRTSWLRPAGLPRPDPPHHPQVRTRRTGDWRAQWELARRLHPEGLLWPYPLAPGLFNPASVGNLLRFAPERHWMWHEEGRLAASLIARLNLDRPGWRLILLAEPDARGLVERPLLTTALAELRPGRTRYSLELPAGMAEDTLQALSFHTEHTLTWMELELDAVARGN